MRIKFFLLKVLTILSFSGIAQGPKINNWFNNIEVLSDTFKFSTAKDLIIYRDESHLPFFYSSENQVVEIHVYNKSGVNFDVLPNANYELLDSILKIDDYYTFRLAFKEISSTDFLSLNFKIKKDSISSNSSIKLFPTTHTEATFYPGNDELYIGEEKSFEIVTNNIDNLIFDGKWREQNGISYRLTRNRDNGLISVIPSKLGAQNLNLSFATKNPFLKGGEIFYELPEQTFSFSVKGSRLSYLKIESNEIIKEKNNPKGVEITIDNHRYLKINKTYRVENQEEKGGPLVAELYTEMRLANDKVLCFFRPYLNHSTSEGYLFIKDGDDPKFITNLNILPEVKVETVSILREGKTWEVSNEIYPGETVYVKLDGIGMNRAKFYFKGLDKVESDSLAKNENEVIYELKVPVDIDQRKIEIYHNGEKINHNLKVIEYERPRNLDFIKVNYGAANRTITKIKQPVLYNKPVKDLVISFDENKIDEPGHLYGKQHLIIEIKLLKSNGDLMEMKTIRNIEVCPGEQSPRHLFTDGDQCQNQAISINNYLSKKTYSLDDWSKIEITVRHQQNKYNTKGFEHKIVVVQQKLTSFDVEVTFPAGLLVKKIGEPGFPALSGVSLAMIAQFSFFDHQKINVEKPYKIGAGFLAKNAFNFNPAVEDRDLGIVIIGSVYPIKKNKKLSFPLYAGFGYFVNQNKFFYLIGPGITVNL